VDRAQALEDAQGDGFLPGAPSPGITVPTTVYATTRALPRNLLPASFYRVTPSEHHTPLVIMLVLTQLSVGAFAVDAAARALAPAAAPDSWRPLHALLAVVLGLAALGASVLHLGRPLYAFRAVLGLRTSWMSREILAFGLFAPLALLYAGSFWHEAAAGAVRLPRLAPEVATRAQQGLALAVTLAGAAGVTCSILIYHVTRRPFWSGARVAFRFTLTAVLLGLATAQATATVGSALGGAPPPGLSSATLATLTAVVAAVKLTGEALFLRHLGDRALTPLRRTAYLHTHDLARLTAARFAAGALGGLALPAFLAAAAPGASAPRLALALASLALLVAGELLERTLFFAAVTAPGMPGGLK
jgi:DMSO reductase anchor subunit